MAYGSGAYGVAPYGGASLGGAPAVEPDLQLVGTLVAPTWVLTGAYAIDAIITPADLTLDGELSTPTWSLVGAYQFVPDTDADVTLTGTLVAPSWTLAGTYSFDAVIVPDLSLAGTLAAPDWTLAGAYNITAIVLQTSVVLTGTLPAPDWTVVGAYVVVRPPQTDTGRISGRTRGGYGVARWFPPVVPAPIVAAGHRMVVAQAFGPLTMRGAQPVYAISEAHIDRSRERVVIDGVDFTYFRNSITPRVAYTLLEPLLYGPADLDLPQVAVMEPLGVGELAPLRKYATVIVQDVLDDVVVRTKWKGFINGFGVSGGNVTLQLGGEAHGRAELRNRQAVVFPRVNDLGRQIADAVRDLGLPHFPPLGAVTGIETMTTGGTGHLEHLQGLIAKAWTRAGRQWTVMPDEVTGVYETHRKDGTTIHATAFVDDARTVLNVTRDISDEPNRIYGTGVTPAGMRVRNVKVPGLFQGPVPPFPGHMEMGDTGDGVRLLIGRLHAMGYVSLRDVPGGYDEDIYDAVVALQKDAGLFDDGFTGTASPGEVNLTTWRALYDLDVTGMSLEWAHIEPMAQRRKVRPWRRSGSGTIMGVNPGFDPAVIPVDRNIDYGVGLRRGQMFEHSRAELHDSEDSNWVGEITFHTRGLLRGEVAVGATITADDVMEADALLPGQNLWVPNFDGGTLFHVAAARPDTEGIVTATIDTRFRDAMEVWEVMDRNKESRTDPARRRNQRHRSSTIQKDSIGEWDEIGGLIGNDVTLVPGWNVFETVGAMAGTINRFRIILESPAEFACAVFGRPVTEARLNNLIPEPLTVSGTKDWERQAIANALDDHKLLYSSGTKDEPCGYGRGRKADGDELLGRHNDRTPWPYEAEDRTKLYVAVWVEEENTIPIPPNGGRIMWPQLESGV